MSINKKEIYEKYGIEFKNSKILSPIGFIGELLKVGNSKTGTWFTRFQPLPEMVNTQQKLMEQNIR